MEQKKQNQRADRSGELPVSNILRWGGSRKAAVVAAVHSGLITFEDACRRYALSPEEFRAWEQAIESHGVPGLRVTRLQAYRDPAHLRSKHR